MSPPPANPVLRALLAAASPERAVHLRRFFKTGPGEYGENDRFLGVMVPQIRAIVRENRASASLAAARTLLDSPWHEAREAGLFLLDDLFRAATPAERTRLHAAYLTALRQGRVNNWDLVDASAPTLVGQYLLDSAPAPLPRKFPLLDDLARAPALWENRVAVVATLAFIRRGRLAPAFRQCSAALGHPHDLMHKAVGWMLRECGKKDPAALRDFLAARLPALHPTALRYAIERFPAPERRQWLALRRAATAR